MNFPIELHNIQVLREKMNELGSQRIPFFFAINFNTTHSFVLQSHEINPDIIAFSFHQQTSLSTRNVFQWKRVPVPKDDYAQKFRLAQKLMAKKDVQFINLTQETKVETDLSLKEIYALSHAPYKLWIDDCFVCFSPETFVKISQNKMYAYPMKGTIDANVPDAENLILNAEKEQKEHAAVVDLVKEELVRVAKDIEIQRYRYVDKIKTAQSDLLQVSSEISGSLPPDYQSSIGNIISSLLPAASISGYPKTPSSEIIARVEGYDRGFYTGVFGFFDGENLDSAVMIRFIEKETDGQLVYKSGGGITVQSDMQKEYEELIQKVYVPIP